MDIKAFRKIPKKTVKSAVQKPKKPKVTISEEAQLSDYALSVRTKEIEDLTRKLKNVSSPKERTKLGKKINELSLLNKAAIDKAKFEDLKANPSLPPDWGRKSTKVQLRPTKEEIEKAKKAEAKRKISRRNTINFLGEVSREANKEQRTFSSDMFALSLRKTLGNAKLNRELTTVQKVFNKEKALNDGEVLEISASLKFTKAQKKLLKAVKKKLNKSYKKAQKKFGKKIAKVLFNKSTVDLVKLVSSEVYPEHINKSLKTARKALNQKHMEIEADRKIVQAEIDKCETECPKLAPEDLSVADHSSIVVKGPRGNIQKKNRVQLPGDRMGVKEAANAGISARELIHIDALELDKDGKLTMNELAHRMP